MAEFVYEDLLPLGGRPDGLPAAHHRGRAHGRRAGRAHVPRGRPRGAPAADRDGDARHRPLPAPGAPGPAAPDHRRPRAPATTTGSSRSTCSRTPTSRPAACCRCARTPAPRSSWASAASTCSTDGQRRRERHRQRRVRRLHPAQPALLADGADHDVGGEEHRLQPARADRALRRHRARARDVVQVPVHGQGRRLGQQVLPLPGDQGGPEPAAAAAPSSTRSCAPWARRPARRTTWPSSSAARRPSSP